MNLDMSRFHSDPNSIFCVLQRNNSEAYSGNRLSNKIPYKTFSILKANTHNSMIVSRLKGMNELNVLAEKQTFHDQKIYAGDVEVSRVLSFEIVDGSLDQFKERKNTVILSSSTAYKYFGTPQATGKKIGLFSLGDTSQFTVVAVYKDFPRNSHEEFNALIRYDTLAIESLKFDPDETGVYGRVLDGTPASHEATMKILLASRYLLYKF